MDEESEIPPQSSNSELEPLVSRNDLDAAWIGLGAAIEWIAVRGQTMPAKQYDERYHDACESLVECLAGLPPDPAESWVQGVPEIEGGALVPIPSGIWAQTATSAANDDQRPFLLIATDDTDEWEGAIRSTHHAGYRRVQIRSTFVLENWPENTLQTLPDPRKPRVAYAELQRTVERIIALTPDDISPLAQDELEQLVRSSWPSAPREWVRRLHREYYPGSRRGPNRPRDPDRKARLEEFRQKIMSAELRN